MRPTRADSTSCTRCSRHRSNIRRSARLDEYFCVDLIVEDGRCQGVVAIEIATGEFVLVRGKGGDDCHRRGRTGISAEHQRRHRDWRRYGAGLSPRGAAARHGIRTVSSDLHAGHRPPIHRGCRGEGAILTNKDGYRYLQDYGLGPPDPWPRNKAMELGPRDRISQAFWHEERKGRTISTPARRGRASRPAPPRRSQAARAPAPDCELAEHFLGIDRRAAHPRPSGGALHNGRHPGQQQTAAPLPGLFAAGECASAGIHGANRLGSNSLAELVVFGKVAGIKAAAYRAGASRRANRSVQRQAQDVEHRMLSLIVADGGAERWRSCAMRWRGAWRRAVGIYRMARRCRPPVTHRELKERYRGSASTTARAPGTPNGFRPSSSATRLDVAEAIAHSAINRTESRGAHQRLDGFDTRDDANFSSIRSPIIAPDGPPHIDYGPVTITRRRPGTAPTAAQANDRSGDEAMCLKCRGPPPRRSSSRCLRYRPETGLRARLADLRVPFTDDMSVLQGLQYIKDHLDGTLSFRWSCRMAICGSCGMMIDGEPKLACQTFLRDYHPGPLRDRAARAFPDRARPGGRRDRLPQEARKHQAVLIPKAARRWRKAKTCRPRRSSTIRAIQHCINCMLCYAACPQYGLNPDFLGPGALALLHRYNARLARRRRGASAWSSSTPRMASGAAPPSAIAPRSVPSKSTRPMP